MVDGSLESPCRASVFELLFLSLMVEALEGKMCQNSLPSGGGRSLGAKISGGTGRPLANIFIPLERQGRPWGIFFGFYKTRYILLSDSANCTVLRAVVLTQFWHVTDGQTDGRNCRSQYSACNVVCCKNEVSSLWSPYVIGQTIIFSSCFFLLFLLFFCSPNLSGRRLDVYHTLAHGVALVRI